MRLNRTSLAPVLCFLIMAFTATGFADSQARIVRLSYIEGDVQLDRGDGGGYIRAFLNMPLVEGASLWTKEDARAEIEFEDGSTVRLVPDSIVYFSELRLRSDGSRATALELKDGSGYFNVKKQDHDTFRVTADLREVALEKNSEFRMMRDLRRQPPELSVAVIKGEVRFVTEDGQRIAVKKNETITVDFEDAGRYFLAKGIAEEAHDYWNREREADRVELARKAQQGLIYVADLQRYGTYFDVAGYGRVWRPAAVSFSWDPFSNGNWVWYPGSGYVWVSDYVWGWTPFRYGSWVHIGGRGWCWQPAVVYTTWVPRPVIVNPPSGYVGPVVPSGIPRGPVIRVGRGVDSVDFRDDRRHREPDAPGVLIQDRVRGVRQVDASLPADRLRPSGIGIRPVDSDRRVENPRRHGDGDRDRPSDGGGIDARARTPRTTEGVKVVQRGPRNGEIDAQQENDVPTRVVPQAVVTPEQKPAVAPVNPVIQDRPGRTPRLTPTHTAPVSPVIQERPSRPSRVDPTPPPVRVDRVERPPERSSPTPTQVAPSSPPPQRLSPPPPPPSRSAPQRDGVKDQ